MTEAGVQPGLASKKASMIWLASRARASLDVAVEEARIDLTEFGRRFKKTALSKASLLSPMRSLMYISIFEGFTSNTGSLVAAYSISSMCR